MEGNYRITHLLVKSIKGTLTRAEQEEIVNWRHESAANENLWNDLHDDNEITALFITHHELDKSDKEDYAVSLTRELQSKIKYSPTISDSPKTISKSRSWLWYAASVLLLVTIGLFYFTPRLSKVQQELVSEDLMPAGGQPTLTLSDGRRVQLDSERTHILIDDEAVYADGSPIGLTGSFRENVQDLTLTIGHGGTYKVTLADGTTVWLNANSTLTYPSKFIHETREVQLEGEAYFEVAKDKLKPFIVRAKGQEIEVLGTKFNVNSYHNEPTVNTTLLEGAIKVTSGSNILYVKPGEQVASAGETMELLQVHAPNVIDWTEGDFNLNHVNFKVAMRKIARWYDVDIVYDITVPDDLEAGGWISRDRPLSHVLHSIEATGMVKFKVEGRKIHVLR